MLKALTSWWGSAAADAAPARVPDGTRLYAVGDIHGRDDLLARLLERIRADAAAHPQSNKILVYLGDYIDRGPSSREVIERLTTQPMTGFHSLFLMGNHEQAMLGFMEEPHGHADWLTYGGLATLHSYGVADAERGGERSLEQLAAALQERLPAHHRQFFSQLQAYYSCGDYVFVHAGIRPGLPMAAQSLADLLWIRDDFLRYKKPHTVGTVVHGHQITDSPDVRANRIGIDTGAFATGCLTALVLSGSTRAFIDTR